MPGNATVTHGHRGKHDVCASHHAQVHPHSPTLLEEKGLLDVAETGFAETAVEGLAETAVFLEETEEAVGSPPKAACK